MAAHSPLLLLLFFRLALGLVPVVKEDLPPSAAATTSLGEMAKRSLDDLLKTPEWLQNIPKESKMAKYRKRRQIGFPSGSSLNVEIIATLPTVGVSDSGKFILETDLNFNLPTNATTFVTGRALAPGDQRVGLYERLEKFLTSWGYDGHACTLRSICEVAEMPFEHGLIGEVANLILTVTTGSYNDIDGDLLDNEYSLAQYYGQHHGSCHEIYPACPISITNFISMVVPSF
ncbi:hypothetical protein Pmani_027780 [Petrolisthes manimaculis]|uniref:Uncharacterized protein n=1 Tax=Petrolisthes manimaculis TaxID=1843537 RepID=A0AAE1P2A6_9EUCA|nr:hypothetical protein Pmani_027780 [Petrolisthes manimaculis]